MHGRGIVFTGPEIAELEPVEVDPRSLGPGEVLVRAEYSVVSAGTEGSFFTNLMPRTPPIYRSQPVIYPARTGYGHLGKIVAIGPGVNRVAVGDRVLTFSRHASVVRANAARFALPVDHAMDGRRAVFARMAGVSMSALRSSSVQAGDRIAIIGLGLVGNFAAQLFQLAGADVIAFDISELRLHLAELCGIHNVHNSRKVDPIAVVRDWVGARDDCGGANIVVEAIGDSALVAQATEMAGRHGEVILLGSPRAPLVGDLTPAFARIHLLAIRMIGALEWTFPIAEDTERARVSIERNYRQLLRWIDSGRLIVDPLITHVLAPDQCQEAYAGLAHRKDEYVGVVFDWVTTSG
jgi:2-desacetyl-2-hydroxyethyl bacteriochlorophyllide A dehydrogenase